MTISGIQRRVVRLREIRFVAGEQIYIHRGRRNRLTIIEDVITGVTCRAIVPSGDCGKKGRVDYRAVEASTARRTAKSTRD